MERYIDWAESAFDRGRVNRARCSKNILKEQVKRLQSLDDCLRNHAASKAQAAEHRLRLCNAKCGGAW